MRKLALVLVSVVVIAGIVAATAQAAPTATCTPKDCGVWQQGPVTLTWTDSDMAGNPTLCPPSWDTESPSPSGSVIQCNDGASDGAGTVTVFVDKTPPALAPTLDAPPNANGWYNSPPTLLLHPSDLLSGVTPCAGPTYSGGDNEHATLSGTCMDVAGNTSPPDGLQFQYDATPPVITGGSLDRPPDSNGWYNHPVSPVLTASDNLSLVAGCGGPAYSGPNGPGVVATGTCTDEAGNTTSGGVPLAYDATPPVVTGAAADRPADHDGWFNHPVTFNFHGTDGTSGVAGCTSASYSGPVDPTATVNGACTDNAGNVGLGHQSFKYDDVKPAAADVQTTPGNHRVDVSWTLPRDAASVTVSRSELGTTATPMVVYSGNHNSFLDKGLQNGTKYRYSVEDMDQAGNTNVKVVRAIPTASSLRPFVGTVVNSPPLLTWKTIKGASYYNVQLWYGNKKVLSIWPRTPSLQVKRSWRFRRKAHTLAPGHYRWYVWPGFGPLSSHRYGNRIGRSSFRVR